MGKMTHVIIATLMVLLVILAVKTNYMLDDLSDKLYESTENENQLKIANARLRIELQQNKCAAAEAQQKMDYYKEAYEGSERCRRNILLRGVTNEENEL